ncbi:GHKL domain-containing protein [Duganella sp. FT80W]|uniref:histidine kinase n=1 Tax=Duganella guangzhouensis TaxID=2666084 RepID=A0A6I2L2Y0_9BURK|nr:ATP-binding protein [Duganella guangzhouensis]MRW90669.1 GHKL domain-containing protein [Duganella guangzhouensis]
MARTPPLPDLRPARINALGEFAASIAHEVKQPLAAITLNAQAGLHWLEQDPPRLEQARVALRVVLQASRAATGMVRSLHGMTCQAEPERSTFFVDDMLRDVLQLLRGELRQHEIRVSEEFGLARHQLYADQVQLMQVIMNLLQNGIDALHAVHGRERTLALRSMLMEDALHISVTDNGAGIAPELAERIFDPLFSTKPGGTGMGLTICHNIVQAHGGRLWATTAQPHGTVFHLSFKEYTLWTPSRS